MYNQVLNYAKQFIFCFQEELILKLTRSLFLLLVYYICFYFINLCFWFIFVLWLSLPFLSWTWEMRSRWLHLSFSSRSFECAGAFSPCLSTLPRQSQFQTRGGNGRSCGSSGSWCCAQCYSRRTTIQPIAFRPLGKTVHKLFIRL